MENLENDQISDKEFTPTLLLNIFLGGLGAHSFYVGKVGIGIAQLLTLGGCGIWSLYDLIMIATKKYTDSEGKIVSK